METQRASQNPFKGRIASIDRRSLSQAWYSAMHMAERPGAKGVTRRFAIEPSGRMMTSRDVRSVAPRAWREHLNLPPIARGRDAVLSAADAKVRSARNVLPAPASVPRTPRPAPEAATAFTLAFRDARVHIHVRRGPGGLQVVALCSGRHVDAVTQALAAVEYALRSKGERVAASVVPLGSEE